MGCKKLDFVILNGKVGVVIGTSKDRDIPEDHLAIWFGSVDSEDLRRPEVFTVPQEYVTAAGASIIKH